MLPFFFQIFSPIIYMNIMRICGCKLRHGFEKRMDISDFFLESDARYGVAHGAGR